MDKLIDAAEDYVWPEPLEELPGFGEPESFKARCREYYAFIAGASWGRENTLDEMGYGPSRIFDGVKINAAS